MLVVTTSYSGARRIESNSAHYCKRHVHYFRLHPGNTRLEVVRNEEVEELSARMGVVSESSQRFSFAVYLKTKRDSLSRSPETPCGVPITKCLSFVIVEDFREALHVDTRIYNGQTFAQRSECTHQYVDLNIAASLEIRDGLAAIAGVRGNPGLGSAASFTLCPDKGP
jgi:hypothetical protein